MPRLVAPDGRLLSLFVLALMVASALPNVAPEVAATGTAPTITSIQVALGDHGSFPPNATPFAHSNQVLNFTVNMTLPQPNGCVAPADQYTISLTPKDSDVQVIGSAGGLNMIDVSTDGTQWQGDLLITSHTAGGGRDGAAAAVNFTAAGACSLTGKGTGTPVESPTFMLDNTPPTGNFTVACDASPCHVGSHLSITVNNTTASPLSLDAANGTIDLTQVGGPVGQPLASLTGATTWTVQATSSNQATFDMGLTDTSGNSNTSTTYSAPAIDAHPPSAPSNLNVQAVQGGGLFVTLTKSNDADVTGSAGYQVTETVHGKSTSRTVVGSGDGSTAFQNVTSSVAQFGSNALTFNLTAQSPFDNGTAYDVTVAEIDNSGNVGANVTVANVVPSSNPASVNFAAQPIAVKSLGSVNGAWSSVANPTSNPSLGLWLENTSTGRFYDNNSNWVLAPSPNACSCYPFPAPTNFTSNSSWWGSVAPLGSDTYADGSYAIGIDLNNSGVVAARAVYNTIVDTSKPTITPPDATHNDFVTPVQSGIQHGGSFKLHVNVSDTGSGLASLVFAFQASNTNTVANDTFGNPAVISCIPVTPSCSFQWDGGSGSANLTPGALALYGNVTLALPPLPFGNYSLVINTTDLAGNSPANVTVPSGLNNNVCPTTNPTCIWVQPRVQLLDISANAIEPGSPFYDGSGVSMFLFAGYNASNALQDNSACPQNTCQVTEVDVYGRNSNSNTAVFLGQSSALASTPGPIDSTLVSPGDGLRYYNYSLPAGHDFPLKGLDPTKMLVEAVALVNVNGVTYMGNTTWIPVRLNASGSLLSITYPSNDTYVYMNLTDQTGWMNFTYTKAGLDATPTLDWVVIDNATGADVSSSFNATGTNSKLLPTGLNAPPVYFYNITFVNATNAPIPRGDYVLHAWVNGSIRNQPIGADATRFFGVETQSPTIDFSGPQPEIFHGYVRPTFNVSFRLRTGYANLSSLGRVNVTLSTPNPNAPGNLYLTNNTGGFNYSLLGFQVLPSNASSLTDSLGTLQINLPSGSADGTRYSVLFNVTTDSADPYHCKVGNPWQWMGGCAIVNGQWIANATGTLNVFIDTQPPSSGVYTDESNNTGNTTQLQLFGFASDSGSGVKTVQVRVIDLNSTLSTSTTGTATFDPRAGGGQGGFVPDVQDAWLSSDLTYFQNVYGQTVSSVRDVVLTPPTGSGTTWLWAVDSGAHSRQLLDANGDPTSPPQYLPPIPFDVNHTYRIDVRAQDNINPMSAFTSYVVAFDVTPPVVKDTLQISQGLGLPSSSQPAWLNWHGPGYVFVNVSDNHCLARVSLDGTTPSGAQVPRADFAPPADGSATCGALGSGQGSHTGMWMLDLSLFPNATDEVGWYNDSIDAVDTAGNVDHDARTVMVHVNDTQPAIVRPGGLHLEPPVVPSGTRSTLVAEIFENYKLLNVTAQFQKLTDDGRVDTSWGNYIGTMHPSDSGVAANGSGNWVISTDTDFGIQNLSAGAYLWTVTPYDANYNLSCLDQFAVLACPSTSTIVRVTDEAPPFVAQDSPASGATVLNATPTFAWRVLGKNIAQSDVSVTAGPVNGTLSPVAATFTPLAPVGSNATGFAVGWTPPSLANATNYSVLVTVSSNGIVTGISWSNYTIDAIPPTVNATVTGTVDIGGRTYATSSTRITLSGADNESGLAGIVYRVNGGAAQAYGTPFTPSGPDGAWHLDYQAIDNAGNTANGSLDLTLDATGPVISLVKGGDDIVLTVSDAGVGVDPGNVTVHYAYGDAQSFTVANLAPIVGNSYHVTLPGNASATGLRYYFEALDLLGNLGTLNTSANPIAIAPNTPPQDLPPVLTITAPTNGTEARDSVDLKWIAQDPEGQPVTINIALRDPTSAGTTLVTNGDNTGEYLVNLTGRAAGAYTIVVTASDGANAVQQSVTFTIPTQRPRVECTSCPPANLTLGHAVNVGVSLNPVGTTVASATYAITRDGQVVAGGNMTQAQGLWIASYQPTQPGVYKVLVTEVDADGTAQPAQEVTTFEVQGSTAGPAPVASGAFPGSLLTLLVLAILTIALAAYGAFLRWKP